MKIQIDKTTKGNFFLGIGFRLFPNQPFEFRIYLGKIIVIFTL